MLKSFGPFKGIEEEDNNRGALLFEDSDNDLFRDKL